MATLSSSSLSISFFSSSIFTSKPQISSKTHLKFPSSSLSQYPISLSIKSELATLPILNFSGEKTGETYLNLKTAPPDTARAVVHRALITHLQNKRRGTASTLTRAEVRGGGRKPYPQKKTGRARRGSQRSPLRPGGGVVFGPKPRDWSIKMNKKEKRLALSTAIASGVENLIVVEEFGENFQKPRTKDFISAMERWGVDPSEKSTFLMIELEENVEKSGRNIGSLKMLTPRSLNLFDILGAEKLVFTTKAVDFLNQRYGVDSVDDDEDEDDNEEEEEEQGQENDGEEDGTPEATE
ncbi:50S ribosomal protein L4, chloroplastic isoform X1 [Amaranthus tricolor]|uniref:50S ribosomal protein L4, chloroplastic isoform X1 n=1 Tax=Amaranthus tricolor TaxID=29722 RepID=UPI0025835465|nr:50S ribosomal protein L4, chloroplastic isoform X1 [Amaranthus tricolor]